MVALGCMAGMAAQGRAQVTATLLPNQITLPAPTTGYSGPQGVTFDSQGNLYVTDPAKGNVVKVTATGTVSVTSLGAPYSKTAAPEYVATDTGGDVYVTDTVNNRLIQVNTGIVQNNTTYWNLPTGIAVDNAGDIFVTNAGNNTVVEIPGGFQGAPQPVSTSGLTTPLNKPAGIAVDLQGNLYIADTGNARVVELQNGGSGTEQALPISGLTQPEGVAVDAGGNLYVTDATNNNVVVFNVSSSTQTTVAASNLSGPLGVVVNSLGNVYIADTAHGRVVEVETIPARNLGQVAVGGFGDPSVLTYTVSGYTGSNYIPTFKLNYGKDASLGTPTCTGGTGPETCSVPVTLQPALPGERADALELVAPGGTSTLANTLVYGVGSGPYVIFGQNTASIVPTSGLSNSVYGIAVDRLGNIFLCDSNNQDIVEVSAATGTQTTVINSGLNAPTGVAVDGADNVYITNGNYGSGPAVAPIVEVPAGGGTPISMNPKVFSQTLGIAAAVAVDGAGDLYVADNQNGYVMDIPAGSGSPDLPLSGLNGPASVAVDASGDLYIANIGNNAVVEYQVVTGSTVTLNTAAGGINLNQPYGIAADAAGDVYIADSMNNRIVEVPAASGTPVVVSTGTLTAPSGSTCPSTPLCQPSALAVDGQGDIFIADTGNSRVVEISPVAAPSLTFPSTNVGSSSTQQTVSLVNIGNQALNLTALNTTTTGQATSSFNWGGAATTCAVGTPVPAGTLCSLGVEFTPTTNGSLSGMINIADNSLNNSSAQQAIAVSGTGTGFAATIKLSANPGTTVSTGTAITVTAALSGSNGTPTGNITYTLDGANPQTVALASGSAQFTLPTTLTAGPHSVTVSYSGDANYTDPTPSQSLNILVQATAIASTTTMGTASPTSIQYGSSVTLTATVTDANGPVTSGQVEFLVGTSVVGYGTLNTSGQASTTTSILPVGTDGITAQFVGSSTDTTSNSTNSATVTVTSATAPPPVQIASTTTMGTASAPSIVYGNAETLTATVSDANGPVTSGTVVFFNGSSSIGAASLGVSGQPAGQVSLTTSILPVGTDVITAQFVGSTTDNPSTSANNVTVTVTAPVTTPPTPIATTTTLTSSATTALADQNVTLTATVTDANGPVTNGTVNYFSGTTFVGTAQMNSSGQAVLVTSFLPVGVDSVTAVFVATATDLTSTSSPAVSVTVLDALAPTVTIGAASASLTVAQGSTVTDVLTFTSVGGFAGSFQVACAGLPAGTSCSFQPVLPVNITANGTQTVTMTVSTTAPVASLMPLMPPLQTNTGSMPMLAGAFWLPGLLLAGAGLRKKGVASHSRHLLVLLVLLAGVGLMTACGGGSNQTAQTPIQTPTQTPTPTSGTPKGTTTMQVVVTGSNNLQPQVLNLSLIVN